MWWSTAWDSRKNSTNYSFSTLRHLQWPSQYFIAVRLRSSILFQLAQEFWIGILFWCRQTVVPWYQPWNYSCCASILSRYTLTIKVVSYPTHLPFHFVTQREHWPKACSWRQLLYNYLQNPQCQICSVSDLVELPTKKAFIHSLSTSRAMLAPLRTDRLLSASHHNLKYCSYFRDVLGTSTVTTTTIC